MTEWDELVETALPPSESEWKPYLDSLWRKDSSVFKTVAVISSPAVEIQNIEDPNDVRTLVIGSLQYQEYERLTADPKPGKP